jgi:tetratricopeptide (TPR) repeat protein
VNRHQLAEVTAKSADRIGQARKFLKKGQLIEAANIAKKLLRRESDNTEALYLLAVCQRYMRKTSDALLTLERIRSLTPAWARAYQEEGHVHRMMNDTGSAIVAYERATSLNPALIASWRALCDLYATQGDEEAAEKALLQYSRLAELAPELVSVTSMLHEDRLYEAERLCRAFLQTHRHHVEAMRLLAQIGARLHILDDAEFLLESCIEFEPDNRLVRFDYINVLHKRQKFKKSLEQARRLRASDPGNPAFELTFANESMAVGDFDTALGIYDGVLERKPDSPHTLVARGHALKTVGRQKEAIASYRSASAMKSNFGDAFWSLANLKTYKFTDHELAQMQASERAASTLLNDRCQLCFALGKAFEDREEFASSFTYYERGNTLMMQQVRYSAERIAAEFKVQLETCTRDLLTDQSGHGNMAADPIFIVGLPRAGSTLIEQIIASHSQVDGTMELPHILALVHRLNGRRRIRDDGRYPKVLQELTPAQLQKFGDNYLSDIKVYRKGAPFFTDKMPNNFRHIGLIHLILPNAKIIDARRDPMACCFGAFKQLFAEGQAFTYGLEEIGRYYRGYVELMDHWDEVLPGKILRVQHEDVVADLEIQVRRILKYCGLPFEQSCLDFHKTERAVRTASSEQVRQPLYKSGLDQWRNYEPWLEPLRVALGQVL